SLTYSLMEMLAKRIDLKKQYELPERELLEYIQKKWRADDVPDFLYKQFNVRKTEFNGRPLFKIQPRGTTGNKVILFIHGGGGMICPTEFHYRMAARLVKNTGATLYFPFYPLAPEHTLPQASAWLDAFYEDVTKRHDPKDITVIGDSAGVSLGTSMCERSAKKPGGIVMISPGTGVEKNDDKMKALEDKDFIMSCKALDVIKKYWSGGLDAATPEFSATYTDYTGFPPILLYYGTNEIFYPYIPELIERIKKYNIPLEIHKGEGLCHDWAIIGIFMESRKASRRICDFIEPNRRSFAN
ncbi:MAG: alpha/beta hydrolase, partial [Oscillospiraceae bacterium]|nr:alpha/beta hydrolase [Oscillospiraceae bacterium]